MAEVRDPPSPYSSSSEDEEDQNSSADEYQTDDASEESDLEAPPPSNQTRTRATLHATLRTKHLIETHLEKMKIEGEWTCCGRTFTKRKGARIHAKAHYSIGLCRTCGYWDPVDARISERHSRQKGLACRDYQLARYDQKNWGKRRADNGITAFPLSGAISRSGRPGERLPKRLTSIKEQCTTYLESLPHDLSTSKQPTHRQKKRRRTHTSLSQDTQETPRASTSTAAPIEPIGHTLRRNKCPLTEYLRKRRTAIENRMLISAGTFKKHYKMYMMAQYFLDNGEDKATPEEVEELLKVARYHYG